jgi:hypothetical protein
MAVIIQPRLGRGRGAVGGVITGGDSGGGVGGKGVASIMPTN